jgi:hypothetical protein
LPARLKGWTVAGIIIVQSGLPMTLTDPNGGGVYGHAAPSTVTLCPGASYADLVTAGDTGSRLNRWIDTAAICAPAGHRIRRVHGLWQRRPEHHAGSRPVQHGFLGGQDFPVGGLREDAVLAFRTEFYNALNHPQFANPGTSLGTASFGRDHAELGGPAADSVRLKYLF